MLCEERMKTFVVICSCFLMNHLWAMGSFGFRTPQTEAMGDTTAVLNQITEEQETEPTLEEVHRQQEMDAEEARKSQEPFPDTSEDVEQPKENQGPLTKPLP
jgi:hypothetical protein